MVEGSGFEPLDRCYSIDSLANCWFKPLTQPSILAVMEGFEPLKRRLGKGQLCLQAGGLPQYPYFISLFPAPETGGCVCQFRHITILMEEGVGFEPTDL